MPYEVYKTVYQDARPDAGTRNLQLRVWCEIYQSTPESPQERTPVRIATNKLKHFFAVNPGSYFEFEFSLALSGESANLAHCAVAMVLRNAGMNTKTPTTDEPITLTNLDDCYLIQRGTPLVIKGLGSGSNIQRFMALALTGAGDTFQELLGQGAEETHPIELSFFPLTEEALLRHNNGADNVFFKQPVVVKQTRFHAYYGGGFHSYEQDPDGPVPMGGAGAGTRSLSTAPGGACNDLAAVAVGPATTVAVPAPSVEWGVGDFQERAHVLPLILLTPKALAYEIRVVKDTHFLESTMDGLLSQSVVPAPVNPAPNPYAALAVAAPAPALPPLQSRKDFSAQLRREKEEIDAKKATINTKLQNLQDDKKQLFEENADYVYTADETMLAINRMLGTKKNEANHSKSRYSSYHSYVEFSQRAFTDENMRISTESCGFESYEGYCDTFFGFIWRPSPYSAWVESDQLDNQFQEVMTALNASSADLAVDYDKHSAKLQQASDTLEAVEKTLDGYRLKRDDISNQYAALKALYAVHQRFSKEMAQSQPVYPHLKSIEKSMNDIVVRRSVPGEQSEIEKRKMHYQSLVQEAEGAWNVYKGVATNEPRPKSPSLNPFS
ncbi:MAG: hypothetical protein DHS20C10_13840 [marine bacterium B5-7]|nr:MAG: hypothetical protein DHS20C10_13840 [marine bacterium B5-7]